MNENEKLGFWYSWPTIIFTLILFWPIGVFLIIKRVSKDKKTEMNSGKLINGLGIASYCMAILGFIVFITESFAVEDIVLSLFFGAAGFVLRKIAMKIKMESENIKQYLSIIINGNVRQLYAIASTTGKSYDIVYKDIKKMIEKGYLKNAYINENLKEVVLPNDVTISQNDINVTTANTATTQSKIIACPCCGANNTIYGNIGECEYCGSPLK